MMFNKTTLEKITITKVLEVVKLSLFLTLFWPLPKDAIKLKVFCVALYHYVSLFLHVTFTLALLNTVLTHITDPVMVTKAAIFICATSHAICNIVSYRLNPHYIQSITFEMEDYCKSIDPHEQIVFQQYINKCSLFYGGSICGIYLIDIFIVIVPLILDFQPFPTNAEYPFDMLQQPMRTLIYLQQSICALQIASHLCMNSFTSFLIWFTSARFELLTEKLREIKNIYDLMKCVEEHQKLLKYAEQVIVTIRPFAFITISLSTAGLIIVGLIFITDQPISMKIQCVGLAFSGLSEVFMYTWPAEHLIHISSEIGEAIYNANWYDQSIQLRSSLQIILMKSQRPLTISIPCVMPSLSLSYYAAYLSTIFSYFTTLRIFMQTNEN